MRTCVRHPEREAWGATGEGPLCAECLDTPRALQVDDELFVSWTGQTLDGPDSSARMLGLVVWTILVATLWFCVGVFVGIVLWAG